MRGFHDWLGELSREDFLDQYLHKLPYSGHAQPCGGQALCDVDTLGRILEQPDADVMVCRRGELYAGDRPTNRAQAEALADQGYTILVRHAERHDEQIAALAESFRRDFLGEVTVHVYSTPGEQFGFGWHYDAEEVFILQTTGKKEYQLRKNTVHPWPLVETIPADMQYQRELMPLMRCLLHAGDWLYIPTGYWHQATALEPSISLAVGVLSPSALDIYQLARGRLAQSLQWRQRVAGQRPSESDGTFAERRERYRDLLRTLSDDLVRLFQSDAFLDDVLQRFS